MLYREDDVPDWLTASRSIIRLEGDDMDFADEEEMVMTKIMSRYDEDSDNLAYANDEADDDIVTDPDEEDEDEEDWGDESDDEEEELDEEFDDEEFDDEDEADDEVEDE